MASVPSIKIVEEKMNTSAPEMEVDKAPEGGYILGGPLIGNGFKNCFEKPIFVRWGKKRHHNAFAKMKAYTLPDDKLGYMMLVMDFPDHNLTFLYDIPPPHDAYLVSEKSVNLRNLNNRVEVFQPRPSDKCLLPEDLEEEREHLVMRMKKLEGIPFATLKDAVAFLELVRGEKCLGTSDTIIIALSGAAMYADIRVQFWLTKTGEVVLVPTTSFEVQEEMGEILTLTPSFKIDVTEHVDELYRRNSKGDIVTEELPLFDCTIHDEVSSFVIRFRAKEQAAKFEQLFNQVLSLLPAAGEPLTIPSPQPIPPSRIPTPFEHFFSAQSHSYDQVVSTLHNKITSLKNEITDLNTRIDQYPNRLTTKTLYLPESRPRSRSDTPRIRSMAAHQHAKDKTIEVLESQLRSYRYEIGDLRQRIDQLLGETERTQSEFPTKLSSLKIEKFTTELAEKDQHITNLSNKLGSLSAENKDLEKRLGRTFSLLEEIEDKERWVRGLEQRIKMLEDEREGFVRDLKGRDNVIRKLEDEVQVLNVEGQKLIEALGQAI